MLPVPARPARVPRGGPQAAVAELTPRRRAVGRVLFHLSLLAAFAAAGGSLLVWPQWVLLDGNRTALAIQRDREQELTDRFEHLRALNARLRDWSRHDRKVWLPEEAQALRHQAAAVASQEGARLHDVRISARVSPRWHSLVERGALLASSAAGSSAEVRPSSATFVLSGPFPAVYRAATRLCRSKQLIIPDSWQLAPTKPNRPHEVRLQLTATLFVLREEEDGAAGAPAARPVGPLAWRVGPAEASNERENTQ